MEQAVKKTNRLGRGLSSLMSTPVEVVSQQVVREGIDVVEPSEAAGLSGGERVQKLALDKVRVNPNQPRQQFDGGALEELSASIKKHGVMQPVLVRQAGADTFELIAGERRWRAAKLAGLADIPAVVRDLDAKTSAEWALVENLQREDLNPLERADAFQKLIDGFGLTHEQVAEHVGVHVTSVTNHLRLLRLHPDVQSWLTNNLLSMGHARALAGIDSHDKQLKWARQAIEAGWSVRQLEAAVRLPEPGLNTNQTGDKPPAAVRSAVVADIERQLSDALTTRVTVKSGRKKGSGVLSIEYHSLDEFDALIQRMGIKLQ